MHGETVKKKIVLRRLVITHYTFCLYFMEHVYNNNNFHYHSCRPMLKQKFRAFTHSTFRHTCIFHNTAKFYVGRNKQGLG